MHPGCEWCGKEVTNSLFPVIHGYSSPSGAVRVGDCCGIRSTGLIKPELAGPLLTESDHSECCGYKGPTPYAHLNK